MPRGGLLGVAFLAARLPLLGPRGPDPTSPSETQNTCKKST